MLTLKEAMLLGKLEEFIKQEETRGVGAVDRNALDSALSKLIKQPRSKGQTSRSPSRGDSSGK